MNKILKRIRARFMSQWFVCRVTSGRKSARYGIRFSYPLIILSVTTGILLVNLYILSITALISFLGVLLPMHPFDYLYNYGVSKVIRTDKIPGRGSELQVSSIMTLIFNLVVIAFVINESKFNYEVMAIIYVLISSFFITVQLFSDDFSFYSIYNFLFKKNK